MYKVTVLCDGKIYPLHIPGTDDLILYNPVLTLEMGSSGSFHFRILPHHPQADKIHPLSSEFYVYEDDEEIFRGRYTGKEEDFYKTGKVTCEGDLAYLIDSQQRPYEHQGSIIDFLNARLADHNSQVEERKQFRLGKVTVVDSNNYINRSDSNYSNTLECIRGKLVKTHGGYPHTRLKDGVRYLDYVKDYGASNAQVIRFGENLLDLNQHIDPTTIITALIPLGASVEVINPDGTIDNRRIDITSVNKGIDYIYEAEAVQQYGWIVGIQEWEDVTLPENLLAKARTYLKDCVKLPRVLELTAVDLSMIEVDIQALKVGYWTKIVSEPHEVTGTYLLTKRTYNLTSPEQDKIVLGGELQTFSGSSAKNKLDMSLKVQQVAMAASKEINAKVENATQLITGGLGGYVVIGRAENGHPEEILIMDAPTKEIAKNVIRLNQNGLGFSTSGYDGPYRNAWTIDGNLVADFITTGTMYADRIRGGTLTLGGKNNASGVLLVVDDGGRTLGQIDRDGVFAIAGRIAGWTISENTLTSESGTIISYEGTNHNNRATMNNASYKIWVGGVEQCYLGRGGYNNWGRTDSGLLHIGGRSSIELDGSTGKVNAGGDVEAQGKVKSHDGAEIEGSCTVTGRGYFQNSVEVSRDLMCGGRVDGTNISEMAGRIAALEAKIGS